MITNLKPYPEMNASGVRWLGDVPQHWEVKRLRDVAGMRVSNIDKHSREDEEPVRLCNYVDVYKHDRITPGMPFMKATAAGADVERFRLRVDDVLITKDSETWTDIGVPALVEYVADDLVSGYHLALLRPIRDRLQGSFLFRVLQSPPGAYQFHVEAKGVTRYGLSHGAIKSAFLPVPPLPEQTAIVRFLDYADRRIRRYIRAKQKLIKLLEEQKQATIHRAVTRGLDPDVPLKDSGVEWLGEVPDHWEVTRVKGEFECLNRRRIPLSSSERGEMTLRRYDYYGASGVIDQVDDYLFDDELLLIAEDGANLVLRNLPLAIIARGRFWVNNHAHILKPRRGNLDFLAWTMEAMNYEPWISGAAQPKLTKDRLMGISIAVPPRQEQDRIVQSVSGETMPLREAAAKAQREVSLLRELRSRLIADVVTGKLDVRDVATRLPEEGDGVDEVDYFEEDETALEDMDLDAELEEIEA